MLIMIENLDTVKSILPFILIGVAIAGTIGAAVAYEVFYLDKKIAKEKAKEAKKISDHIKKRRQTNDYATSNIGLQESVNEGIVQDENENMYVFQSRGSTVERLQKIEAEEVDSELEDELYREELVIL